MTGATSLAPAFAEKIGSSVQKPANWVIPAVGVAALGALASYYLLQPDAPRPFPGPDYDTLKEWADKVEDGTDTYEMHKLIHEYNSKIISLKVGGNVMLVCVDPKLMEISYKNSEDFARWDSFKEAVGVLTSHALFAMEGAPWKRHRSLILKAFNQNAIRYANSVAITQTKDLFQELGDVETIRADDVAQNLAFSVFCEAFFSYRPTTEELPELVESFRTMDRAFQRRIGIPKWLWWFYVKDEGDIPGSKKKLKGLLETVIKSKGTKTKEEGGKDILDALLATQTIDGQEQTLSMEEVTDEILGMSLRHACHQTHANPVLTICFTVRSVSCWIHHNIRHTALHAPRAFCPSWRAAEVV